ncbi:Predicted acetyltransferase [Nonomuraea maritima]|uniref:Predicted acetyltransferase n=1 Tax=Nonomuraea maritima TaxID=683260 RepID=A0A1G9F9J0_9ACTN|nr:GNAT family N-acetyltransferase [Nonomuraea maritima]SDK85020.1 Predicted acetyltransferase [Nonomuraea maritima]
MPEFIDPVGRLLTSFLAAVAEFRADHDYPVPWFVDDVDPQALVDPAAFEAYAARVVNERTASGVRPGLVPMTTLWWVDGEQFLGRLAIRHRLTPALEQCGGHIGYDVRPSARRLGHATAMLAAALPIARSMGISEALVMCDKTNTASRKVIEANGGQLLDVTEHKRRYWVPLRRLDSPQGRSSSRRPRDEAGRCAPDHPRRFDAFAALRLE